MSKQHNPKLNNKALPERRALPFEFRMEDREEGQRRIVRGHGAIYESLSEDLGGFREIIHDGAFNEAIAVSDIRALVNHDPSKVLARTSAGNLTVGTDAKGLTYEFSLGQQSYARDLAINLDEGNITQSSFAFTVQEDSWEETDTGEYIRHIYKVRELFDVSPVTYPAYRDADARTIDTRAAKTGLSDFIEAKQKEIAAAQAEQDKRESEIAEAAAKREADLRQIELNNHLLIAR